MDPGLLHGQSYCLFQPASLSIRCRHVRPVGTVRVSQQKTDRFDTALPRAGGALQDHQACPFAEQQTTPSSIKGPYVIPRKRSEAIEAVHDKAA
jgi:hypothetical protein